MNVLIKIRCLVLDKAAFERLLGPCMDIMKNKVIEDDEELARVFGTQVGYSFGTQVGYSFWHPGRLQFWHPGRIQFWHPGRIQFWHPGRLQFWHPGQLQFCIGSTKR